MKKDTLLKYPTDQSGFYQDLKETVQARITQNVHKKAVVLLWVKLCFYSALFCSSYSCLYLFDHSGNVFLLSLNYIFIGLAGILLAFNASHDAVHNTFSARKYINNIIYTLTFNLQGVNGYLWRIRHKASHHVFPNVDGCDSDIDDNALLRLSPTQPWFWWHKHQHCYATILYIFYTLHWILIKDFVYLKKENLANLKNQKHSIANVFSLLAWKLFYFFYMIGAPVLIGRYNLWSVLICFFIMHAFVSIFFVLTLIISHLCLETKFPVPDENGVLPHGFHRHQLEVSMDYHPTSKLANWIFGGFNSHSAHHLFATLPHTLYVKITPLIKQTSMKYNYDYNELTLIGGVRSHYGYLKKLGNEILD